MIIDLSLFDQALEDGRDGRRKVAPVCPDRWRVAVIHDSDTGACSFYDSESM